MANEFVARNGIIALNNTQITGSLGVSENITTPGTITAQTLIIQTITASQEYSSGSNVFGHLLTNTQTFTGSVNITGSLVTVGSVTGTSFSGAGTGLTGTAASLSIGGNAATATSASYSSTSTSASYASNATSASYANNASTATSASYASTATSASYSTTSTSASYSSTSTSASYAVNATSASYAVNAASASYVHTLNQNVLITGSLVVGSGSIGASENTLTLGPRDAVNEGGQLGFNAPGGTYTSSSMLDLYQNRFRLLRGTNAGSTGEILSANLHSGQIAFSFYNNASSFPGTAVATLAVDSGGNILTVATGTVASASYAVTASYATTATSASYATTAGTANSATTATSASYATTAGTANSATTATSASYATNAGTATTAGSATTATSASYATNAGTANSANTATSASYATTATSSSYANVATSASYATTAGSATSATTATSASYATNAGTATSAGSATTATSASYAVNATSASYAFTSTSASYATTAGSATSATTATSASYASNTSETLSTVTGRGASTSTNISLGGGITTLNNGTSNRITWGMNGVAAPTFTSYSAGVKLVLYDNVGASSTGYTIGINSATMFFTTDTSTSGYAWYAGTTSIATLSGGGTFTATADIVAYSDRRVKENINTITDALNKVLKLRGVTYNRTDVEDKSEKIGFIAQEVQEVIPQVVIEGGNNTLGVAYGNITALHNEAIKEQQLQIKDLKLQVEELKTLVNQLLNK